MPISADEKKAWDILIKNRLNPSNWSYVALDIIYAADVDGNEKKEPDVSAFRACFKSKVTGDVLEIRYVDDKKKEPPSRIVCHSSARS